MYTSAWPHLENGRVRHSMHILASYGPRKPSG